jgi:hypothetical protein
MAGALLGLADMGMEQKGGMKAEQVEIYRKAIAPRLEHFTAAKAARLQIFAGGKARISSSVPAPLLSGTSGD